MNARLRRRSILQAASIGLVGAGLAGCAPAASRPVDPAGSDSQGSNLGEAGERQFGAEWDPHALTIMSWPTDRIWGEDIRYVQKDIARLARAIAEFEPVLLLASPEDEASASKAAGSRVETVPIPVDDLWARDTVSVFVEGPDGIEGVDFNFNGWGDKQDHAHDRAVAAEVLEHLKLPRKRADLVAEGGSLETDGLGTLLVTKSSLVNQNRNPDLSLETIEERLTELLGLKKVIWFDGVYDKDITDAHIDSLVRFVAPGTVLLDVPGPGAPDDVWARSSKQAASLLASSTDARGTSFDVIELPQPDFSRIRGTGDEFLASYVNFFIGNEAVFLPEFGDRKADRRAQDILQEHFPDRDIVPLNIDTIASGGGGIHCATHDVPQGGSRAG